MRIIQFILFFFVFYCHKSHAQLNITNQGGSAEDVVNSIISGGLTISNATIDCYNDSYGTFTNGGATDLGISTGLVLTTGDVDDLNAPGAYFMSSDNWTSCNDPQLTSLESYATNDCCILEFDIIPTCDELQIRFVFGSEEYPEFVNAGFNDAFGFFISGPNPGGGNYNNTNVALLPDGVTIVSIDNVNAGVNAGYYIDNSAGQTNVFDAFTTVLTSDVTVIPCETYHFKLAIADAGDGLYDSGVFVDFLECTNALETSISATGVTCGGNDGTATVTASGGFPNYTYTWNTNPVQSTATATGLAPGIYEVSVDDQGGCTDPIISSVEVVSSDTILTPVFDQVGPYCEGSTLPNLPTTSLEGIIGSWSPAIDNSQTTIYTFTPDPGQCSETQTMEVVIDPLSTPTFDQVGPYCEGSNPPSLNLSSNEGIVGVWGPPGINTSILGPSVYTFVPDAGQCSNTQTMEVVIEPLVTPNFDQMGPFCQGSSIPNINVISNEGITGTWSPGINNTQTTTYTFIPDAGLCSNEQTMEIVVDPLITPTFNPIPPICVGGDVFLPEVSLEGYSGSWSPAIDNSQTTEYTFTPDPGQCAAQQSITVVVGPPIIPNFEAIPPICSGTLLTLPLQSVEGFVGSWSPDVNNTETTTYTFTPDEGQCALNTELIVEVLENPIISAGDQQTVCIGDDIILAASGAGIGGTYTWDNGVLDGVPFNVDETMIYTVVGTDENGCEGSATLLVTALPIPNALFSADPETGVVPLNVVFTNMSENASNYEWDFGNGQFSVVNDNSPQSTDYEDFGTYTVWLIADNGLCNDSTSLIITTTIEPWIFVPNVFTPNGDGSNELFVVSTENMATIELLILNRWGNVITTIDDLNSGWDGKTPAGNDAKEGVYFYKYVATGLDGSEWTGHGFITLIR